MNHLSHQRLVNQLLVSSSCNFLTACTSSHAGRFQLGLRSNAAGWYVTINGIPSYCRTRPRSLPKRLSCLQQILGSSETETEDHFRLDQLNLLLQIRNALFDFIRLRLAVVRWATLQDVADVDILTFETDRFENLVQQLSRPPNERLTLRIFIGAGGLTHKHQRGVWIADAKHELRPRPAKLALLAGANLAVQIIQRFSFSPWLGR